jgi:glycosyltransferase involved in cell wall biosynthesis
LPGSSESIIEIEAKSILMVKPKVTVLMSVYNGDDFLPEAIQSILDQSYGDFEFLIIDDGSAEPLDPILQCYKDKRIVLRRQENMGLTRSLNKGLSLARGDYIARMDADDVSMRNRLELEVRELDSNMRIDLVGCFFDVVDGEGGLIETKELIIDPIYRLWRLQFHNNYGHGTVMLRKTSVLKAGSYDENLSYSQDYDLWSRLSTKNNTVIVPEVMYRYRMVEDGVQASVKNYDTQLTNALRVSDRNLMACDDRLSIEDCRELRALYLKLGRGGISARAVDFLPGLLEGFCRRFRIANEERSRLSQEIAMDVIADAEKSEDLSPDEQKRIIEKSLLLAGDATN